MSGTPARLKTGASTPKQGPLKATIPITSATKEGSFLRSSPIASLSAKVKFDPLMGQRSPGALDFKGIAHPCNRGIAMRRTASLDMIYLRGFFPRDGTGQIVLHKNRATQTEISISLDNLPTTSGTTSETVDDKFARLLLRTRRKSIGRDSVGATSNFGEQNVTGTQTLNTSLKVSSSVSKSSRSSEEGLNQEIERIILRSESESDCNERLRQPTPEGRKAPVADLLRTRCANTQTPPMRFPTPLAYINCFSQDQQSRDTLSPILGHLDTPQSETEDSQDSSPDQYASPRINKFQREPPDGCERVLLKTVKTISLEAMPLPRSLFTLTPSSGSAFKSLNKSTDNVNNSPIVPD